MGWRDSAACLGADNGLFFPDRGASIKPALYFCHRCPVVQQCGEYASSLVKHRGALVVAGKAGVWSGLSAAQRSDTRSGGSRALRGRRR